MSWKEGLEETSPAFKLASSDAKIIRAVAGPGSGKSFAIKKRILRLLEEGVNPEKILAITFTRTAADDLRKEISSLGQEGEKVHTRTVHSHALKILIQAEVLANTGRTPRIVLEHEIRPALKDLELSSQLTMDELKELKDAYLAGWATLQSLKPGIAKKPIEAEFETKLIGWLKDHEGLMVGEVIPVAMTFLKNNPAHPERNKYEVVLIDEYQDLNKSEQEFIKLIAGDSSVVIVGDDDQSIYGFKYAHPAGIQEIKDTYGEFEDVTFDECRRCPQQVTNMASALINLNTNRTLGALNPRADNPNGIVNIIQWATYDDEINGITTLIQKELAAGTLKPSDILILTPRRRNGYQLKAKLTNLNIPAQSYFREDAMSSKSVQYAYSLLNIIANPADLISLRYLLGEGSNDYRQTQYKKIHANTLSSGLSLFETLDKLADNSLSITGTSHIVRKYKEVLEKIATVKEQLARDPKKLFETVFIDDQDDAEDFRELDQLFCKAVDDIGNEDYKDSAKLDVWFNKTFALLQESISTPDVPNDIDHIRIMSLHASKGLGAKLVILCSMIDGLMPHTTKNLTADESAKYLEEQRRLFYVAITRCKSSSDYEGRLVISSFLQIPRSTALRIGYGDASRTNPTFNAVMTSFIQDFGDKSPAPIAGRDLN